MEQLLNGADKTYPRLRASVTTSSTGVELHTEREIFDIEPSENFTETELAGILTRLDGTKSLGEQATLANCDNTTMTHLLQPALALGLIDDAGKPQARSGLAVLSGLEQTINRLLEDLVFAGPFWTRILHEPESLDLRVFYGFGIENWFFLFHEHEFDSAVLSYPTNTRIRAMLNEFYQEEHRHDDIVVRAFESLGIKKSDLIEARPLPTTTSLIKMLSWWARTDPLFFMATIGVLEGRLDTEPEGLDGHVVYDSFLAACERAHVPASYVEPMRAHAKVNASHNHGSVSRELFAELAGADELAERRWQGKAHLFMETYAAFFNGILSYYSKPENPLLRKPVKTSR